MFAAMLLPPLDSPLTYHGPKGWVDHCLESTVGLGWGLGVSCLSLPFSGSDSQVLIPSCPGILDGCRNCPQKNKASPLSQCFSHTRKHCTTPKHTHRHTYLLSSQASDVVTTSHGCCHIYVKKKCTSWHPATLCYSHTLNGSHRHANSLCQMLNMPRCIHVQETHCHAHPWEIRV